MYSDYNLMCTLSGMQVMMVTVQEYMARMHLPIFLQSLKQAGDFHKHVIVVTFDDAAHRVCQKVSLTPCGTCCVPSGSIISNNVFWHTSKKPLNLRLNVIFNALGTYMTCKQQEGTTSSMVGCKQAELLARLMSVRMDVRGAFSCRCTTQGFVWRRLWRRRSTASAWMISMTSTATSLPSGWSDGMGFSYKLPPRRHRQSFLNRI